MRWNIAVLYGFCIVVIIILDGCGSNPIDLVKDGILNFDKSITVGNAFDRYNYFRKNDWKFFESTQKRKIVQFSAIIDLNNILQNAKDREEFTTDAYKATLWNKIKSITYIAQFIIDYDMKGFKLGYSGLEIILKNGAKIELADNDTDILKDIYSNKPISLFTLTSILSHSIKLWIKLKEFEER